MNVGGSMDENSEAFTPQYAKDSPTKFERPSNFSPALLKMFMDPDNKAAPIPS
jgi:hypothetical protein